MEANRGPVGSVGPTGPLSPQEHAAWKEFLVNTIRRLRTEPEQKLLHGDGGLYGETELAYYERLLRQNYREVVT